MNGLRRGAACAAVAVSALVLASCGGSGQPVSVFHATRILSYGDESSVINANFTKYSINGLTVGSTSTVDCTVNPLWNQTVATAYGLVFPDCNPTGITAPVSRILARVGAQAADLVTEVDNQANNGGFADGDLALVYIGVNDVANAYAKYPNTGEPQLTANVIAAGMTAATQVNRLADAGVKVLVATIPNLGFAPLAGGRNTDNAALLGRLSIAYNTALRSNIYNDGRRIGLVLLDEYVQAVVSAADAGNSGATFVDAKTAACAVALPNCTPLTLVSGDASATTWLWADNTHLSAGGQNSFGIISVNRANANPFTP